MPIAVAKPATPGSLRRPSTARVPTLPIELDYVFGMSTHLPNSVHVVSAPSKNESDSAVTILYPAANNAVLFHSGTRSQTILQGHCNPIVACTVSQDRKWAATADTGPESALLIWDLTQNGLPIKSMFDLHGGDGANVVAFSPCAKYLATIGGSPEKQQQTLCIWDWTLPSATIPLFEAPVPSGTDPQISVRFSPESYYHLVSNGYETVYFWNWEPGVGDESGLEVIREGAGEVKGPLNVSAFVGASNCAVTGTRAGDLAVWNKGRDSVWTLAKVHHRLHNAGIHVIESLASGIVITAGEDGFIRFFDTAFRLVTFYERLRSGPILSISLGSPSKFIAKPSIPSLVVATSQAKIVHLTRIGTDPTGGELITDQLVEGAAHAIECMSTHPTQPTIAIAMAGGKLVVWNHAKKSVETRRSMPVGESVTSIVTVRMPKETKDGEQEEEDDEEKPGIIVVGSDKGIVRVFGNDLEDLSDPTQASNLPITRLTISAKCDLIACADTKFAVAVLQRNPASASFQYTLIGRVQAHHQPLVAETPFPNGTRLMSLAQDRILAKYGPPTTASPLANASTTPAFGGSTAPTSPPVTGALTVTSMRRMEQTNTPTAVATSDDQLLVALDAWRLKTYNAHTLACRDSVLAGVFARHPMQWMYPVEYRGPPLIGMLALPYDGNPHRAMGVLAHPDKIKDMCVSEDGKYAFTTGGEWDQASGAGPVAAAAVVKMWSLHPRLLDVQAARGGQGMQPFEYLVNPTGDPAIRRHLEDLFYYAQIREAGENAPGVVHRLKEKVGLSMLPDLLRALGHFPSERDVQQMVSVLELKAVEQGRPSDCTFEDVIRTFLQFRDAVPVVPGDVKEAVKRAKEWNMGDLKSFLMTYGEGMSADEVDKVGYLLDELELGGQEEDEYEESARV
ncbi:quinon protein alcohol dehydrogenase-like superfamily [Catenaria anguillulae PL171]|uniref:Cilia- and flagella-associated protein 251 n=1 Tax=Catenaria anguillulae PL171 TaxID=765915 RepID=A0A1Y2HZK5_9FUNG|nr:quinon protein alcohol dehydrogenase-like superfamily [Catenaria anguillulae PL171]